MKKRKQVLIIVSFFIIVICSICFIYKYRISGDYIDNIIKKYDPQGAEVVLIENNKIIDIRNYGYADINKALKVDDNTRFKIASISKTVTAYAVMQFVDKGELDLDKPISTYLSKWKLPDSEFDNNKITLRTLMSHTSGISGFTDGSYDESVSIEEVLKDENVSLKREAGEVFEYSDFAGFGICQLIIEEVTGMKFEDYMIEDVFTKLGMNQTNYDDISSEDDIIATPYAGADKAVKTSHIVSSGAGGVTTTGRDLAKFIIQLVEYYNNSQSEMFKEQKNTKSSFGEHGLGIIPRKLKNGKTVYEHNGTLTGYNNQIAFEPISGDGIVVLTNSDKAYYLTYELMQEWGKNELGEPVIDIVINKIKTAVTICAFILTILSFLLVIRFTSRIRNKDIEFINLRESKLKIVFAIVIPLAMISIYYILFYTDIVCKLAFSMSNYYPFTFFPPIFKLVSADLLILLIVLDISILFTKKIEYQNSKTKVNIIKFFHIV